MLLRDNTATQVVNKMTCYSYLNHKCYFKLFEKNNKNFA